MAAISHITSRQAPSSPDPDADLISRLAAGDEHALSALMDRHLNSITALAAYMLKDPVAAEDVAQTVFLKTWQRAAEWRPGNAKLITWMRRIATNQCLDMLKKHKPVYTDQVPDMPDTAPQAFDNLAAKDQSRRVTTAMQALPGKQRAALTLSYYQGVSQREGADILDVTEAAYESLLVRARKGLRISLGTGPDPVSSAREILL